MIFRKVSFRNKSYFLSEKWNLLVSIKTFGYARKRFNKWYRSAKQKKGKSVNGYLIMRGRVIFTNNEWKKANSLYNKRIQYIKMKMRRRK